MKKLKRVIFQLLFFNVLMFLNIKKLDAQQAMTIDSLYNLSSEILAPPDLLVQGRFYYRTNSLAKGHPYLISNAFTLGKVFIKDNSFADVPLLIDLDQNEIIMRYEINNAVRLVLLSESSFDSIKVFNFTFLSKKMLPSNFNISFPQLIYDGSLKLIRDYDKDFISMYNNQRPFGSYSDLRSKLIVISSEKAIPLRRKKSLYQLTDNIKALRDLMEKNKIKFRKASDDQLRLIMQLIDKRS